MRACRASKGRGSPHGLVRAADSSTRRRHHGEHATLFSMMLGQLAEARFRPSFCLELLFGRLGEEEGGRGLSLHVFDSSLCRCSPGLSGQGGALCRAIHSEIAEACHGHRPFSRAPPSRPLPLSPSSFFFSFYFNSSDNRFPLRLSRVHRWSRAAHCLCASAVIPRAAHRFCKRRPIARLSLSLSPNARHLGLIPYLLLFSFILIIIPG